MADTEDTPFESFAPFTPEAPPANPPAAGKKRGRKKAAAPEPAPVKVRKKREPKAGKQPRAAHLTVSAAITAFAGLSGPEADLVGRMVIALQGAPKKSRGRIVAALGKVFA